MGARMIILKLERDHLISLVRTLLIPLTPFNVFLMSQIETKFVKEADRFPVGSTQRIIVLC